jgi:mercuric ion transport protein
MALHQSVTITPPTEPPIRTPGAAKNALALLGIATGIGAIAASSCCVVPLVLATLGAGAGVFGTLDALVPWRVPLLVVGGTGVAVGWFAWWRKRRVSCEVGSTCATPSGSRTALALLLLASLIVATAIGWDFLEPALLELMVRSA